MTGTDVQSLLRRAVQTSDSKVMREAFNRLIGRGPDALSADAEYRTRHEDYVMEMPQSGERVRAVLNAAELPQPRRRSR